MINGFKRASPRLRFEFVNRVGPDAGVATAAAAGGAAAAEAGATGGATGAEGHAAALTGAIGRAVAAAVLGLPAANAPRVELTAGGGEVRRTRDRKE